MYILILSLIDELIYTYQFRFNPYYINGNKEEFDEYYIMNKDGDKLTEKFKIVNLNVAKMSKMWYDKTYQEKEDCRKELYWFTALIWETDKLKFNELLNNTLIDKEVTEKIRRIVEYMNSEGALYTYHVDLETDNRLYWEAKMKKASKEALSQGIEQKEQEMVMNMYSKGWSLELIAEGCNLSIDDVKDIIQKNIQANKKK